HFTEERISKLNKRIHGFAWLTLLLCFMVIISACSGAANNAGNSSNEQSRSGGQRQEAGEEGDRQSRFPRTIMAANGEITIEEEPRKVAVVHWGYTDSLLLFNLESVAAALPFTEKQSVLSTESYKPYVDRLAELVIVGENTAVNLEALLDYEPDLIIAGNSVNG